MSRLTSTAPQSLPIDGSPCPINTDFRACLLTLQAIEDPDLTQDEKVALLLDNIYQEPPDNIPEAVKQALWFLSGGKEPDGKPRPKLFDWDIDGDRIFAAMLSKGVNLDVADMHFWVFTAHMAELPESAFTRIVYLRHQFRHGKLTKDERKECDRIGWDIIDLKETGPDMPSDDEIWKALRGE